jgi:hypothetical protein
VLHRIASSLIVAGIFGLLCATASSEALAAGDCSAEAWFPDFRCDDREARPEGSFNPMGMPYLFEDPHITTGLNFAYLYHHFPEDSAFLGGGAHVLALQIRLALTDRLAFIATKDGLTIFRPDNPIVKEDTGIFDMTAGFKYALIDSREHDFILSPALRYEIPMGSEKLYQGYGDGSLIPSASLRWGLADLGLESANLVAGVGAQLPIDGRANSDSVFYNLHLDYGFEIEDSFVEYIVPFIELSGIHYTSSGDGTNKIHSTLGKLPLNTVQAALMNVANLGSRNIAGADVAWLGGGIRLPTTSGVSFGLMGEGPVSSRRDIFGYRVTFMATWEL